MKVVERLRGIRYQDVTGAGQDGIDGLDPAQFTQVHRSTIVNLRHLAGTRRDEASRLFLRLRGHPHELPVSRAYVSLFKAM